MRTKLLGIGAVALLGTLANAQVVVLNQLPTVEANATATMVSQDFDAAGLFPNNDIGLADDFTVSALTATITLAEAYMQGFGGFTNPAQWTSVTAFRVEFYTSLAAGAANLTGDAGSAVVPFASATVNNLSWSNAVLGHNGTGSHIILPVNVNLPGAGTYWVAVIGVLNEGVNLDQVGVYNNLVITGGADATWVNPAGGWGFPGNQQATFSPPADAAYRLTAIPEPGSMIALGLGVAALLARRRRKKA